jgi:hypothetical protein
MWAYLSSTWLQCQELAELPNWPCTERYLWSSELRTDLPSNTAFLEMPSSSLHYQELADLATVISARFSHVHRSASCRLADVQGSPMHCQLVAGTLFAAFARGSQTSQAAKLNAKTHEGLQSVILHGQVALFPAAWPSNEAEYSSFFFWQEY